VCSSTSNFTWIDASQIWPILKPLRCPIPSVLHWSNWCLAHESEPAVCFLRQTSRGDWCRRRPWCKLAKFWFLRTHMLTPFTHKGLIWHARVNFWCHWWAVPCHISSWAVYTVARVGQKTANLTKLWILGAPVPTTFSESSKFGMLEWTNDVLFHTKFHTHRCNLSPLQGQKPP